MIRTEVKGQGKDLLLIHGIMSDRQFFDALTRLMQNEYRMIIYDRNGYGDSVPENGDCLSVSAQAETAAQVIREHAHGPVSVIGHSAGGLIGIALALKYPERVKELLLFEPPLALTEEDRKVLKNWNRELNGYVEQNRIIKALPAFLRMTGIDAESSRNAGVSKEGLRRIFHNLEAFMLGELNEIQNFYPDAEELRKLSMPVYMFVTTGKPDSIFSRCAANASKLLGWPVFSLHGFHNVPESAPEEFVRIIQKHHKGL